MNEIPTSENGIWFSTEEIEAISVTWFSFPNVSEMCPESLQIMAGNSWHISFTIVITWPEKVDF